ncbi:MAG: AAA family ATPase [Bacteroidales bacterium]|jgi:predicted AAA+ superfamily ATPase|nr:AAA family ATPase [Bacteroidales bacterium]
MKRIYLQTLTKRIEEPRKFIQVVVGPRQVGKTTMVNQLLDEINMPYLSESADAISSGHTAWIDQIWESARTKMQLNNAHQFLLVIDEIQKIEQWSEAIKRNWDLDTKNQTNIKVILLGSSRLLIQKGLTESLTGRFEKIQLGHWSFAEMQEAFGWTLDQYIYFGGYPGTAQLITDEHRWKNYVCDSLIETSISKDILMLTRVDKPALLKRLFEIGTLYSGQILSLTKILGELQDAGNVTTLSHYLKLLSESGLLTSIQKYAGEEVRIRASQPKFQVFNNALFSAQKRDTFDTVRQNPDKWGRFVESAVGAHLVNQTLSGRYEVMYWRENNNEIDFILKSDNKIVAIEVKSGRKNNTKGLSVFSSKFKPQKTILVGTSGISTEEFLQGNPTQLF